MSYIHEDVNYEDVCESQTPEAEKIEGLCERCFGGLSINEIQEILKEARPELFI